jgi:hypothetical protein
MAYLLIGVLGVFILAQKQSLSQLQQDVVDLEIRLDSLEENN